MRYKILLIIFFQVPLAESQKEVYGYLGDTVILPSGVDLSWKLSKIEWSIFPNNTWIATFRNEKINTERLSQYKGRLSLNTSTGDLMIHKLKRDDAMEYNVDLINTEKTRAANKIKLIVRRHLQKPTIKTLFNTSEGGGCWVGLNCSSQDKGVGFSWQTELPSILSMTYSDKEPGVLLMFLNTTQNDVEITCTSYRDTEKTSIAVTHNCEAFKPRPHSERRDRCGLSILIGLVMGVVITVLFYLFREKLCQPA